jgi:regulatory protein
VTGKRSRAAEPTPGSPADQTSEADPHEVARSIVLRQLTMAPRSRKQLAEKLAERDVPADVATAVLDRFEEVQLIDDAEFARMWVRSRSQTRALARAALKRELSDKGIDGEIAEEALDQLTPEDELDSARELIRRKIRPDWNLGDRLVRDKHVRRLVAMLARKGYPSSMAYRVVNEELDAPQEPWD